MKENVLKSDAELLVAEIKRKEKLARENEELMNENSYQAHRMTIGDGFRIGIGLTLWSIIVCIILFILGLFFHLIPSF